MIAYQLILIFYESVVPAHDLASFEAWSSQKEHLADGLRRKLPEGVDCHPLISGAVLAAFPESATVDVPYLENDLKPWVEQILGEDYTFRILYTNFLVPGHSMEDVIHAAVDRYEHQTVHAGDVIVLELGEEQPDPEEQESSMDWASVMIQAVGEGRYESARLLFLQIMTLFKNHRSKVLDHVFLGVSMSSLLLLGGSIGHTEKDRMVRLLTQAVIGPDWQNFVLRNLEEICRSHRKNRMTRFDSFEQRVHDYVDREIVNSKLDLKTAAEHFDLTPTYFSQKFKEEIGIGFQLYVEQMRMQIGHDLLRQRGMTVSRAARECGYENVGTFRRNFKRYYGINPGDTMKQ